MGMTPDEAAEFDAQFDSFHCVFIEVAESTPSHVIEHACQALFSYSPSEARVLRLQVTRDGQAPVAVLRTPAAYKAVEDLNRRGVHARLCS